MFWKSLLLFDQNKNATKYVKHFLKALYLTSNTQFDVGLTCLTLDKTKIDFFQEPSIKRNKAREW